MKKDEFLVRFKLGFSDLTCDEICTLEAYLKEGLCDKQWGNPEISFEAVYTGERPEKKAKKSVTKEEVLALEKAKGTSCGN
jgi:hypothetical protein